MSLSLCVCVSVCSHFSSLVCLMPHMCLKVVLRVLDNFQGCSKSVPFPRMFQVCFTGVLMMFHGCSKSVKDVSKCVLRCFKVALMVVLKCLRLFQNFFSCDEQLKE